MKKNLASKIDGGLKWRFIATTFSTSYKNDCSIPTSNYAAPTFWNPPDMDDYKTPFPLSFKRAVEQLTEKSLAPGLWGKLLKRAAAVWAGSVNCWFS